MRHKRIDERRKKFDFDREPGSFMGPTLGSYNARATPKAESRSFSNIKLMINCPSEVSSLAPARAGGLRKSVGRAGSVLTGADARSSQPSLKAASELGDVALAHSEAANQNKLRR